jgi:hypothetical protein
MSKILYEERKEWPRGGRVHLVNWIAVTVRSWSEDHMCPDVVIHTRVSKQGERIVDLREVFPHGDSDAVFIRKGIERFDVMVAQHEPRED